MTTVDTAPTTPTAASDPGAAVLNTASLIVGSTRSGKSSLLTTVAEYVWETFGLVSHYVLTDGGGFPPQMQALIELGIVRFWRARTRSGKGLAFETMQRAAQGWWPAEINPATGVVDPYVRLVPPVTTTYTMLCPNHHAVRVGPVKAVLVAQAVTCPTCKVLVTAQNAGFTEVVARTPGFEQQGALLIDGMSSFCSWMMDDLSERSGRNELGGEKGAIGTIMSGDLAIGGTNRAMYGSVQQRIEAMVLSSNSIPYLAIPPVWTALTQEMSDEGGLSVIGPLMAGSAKTAVAPQWFGDVLETVLVEQGGKRFRRLYLQQWMDERNRRHLIGVRSFPGTLPEYWEEEEQPDGAGAFTAFSMANFYKQRNAALTATREAYQRRFTNAPGLQTIRVGGHGGPAVEGVQTGTPGPSPTGQAGRVQPSTPGSSAAPSAAARAKAAQGAKAKPVAGPVPAPVVPVPAPVVTSARAPAPAAEVAAPVADPPAPVAPAPEPVQAASVPVEAPAPVAPPAAAIPSAVPAHAPVATVPRVPSAGKSPAQLAAERARQAKAPGAIHPPAVAAAAPGAPQPPARGPVAPPPGRAPQS